MTKETRPDIRRTLLFLQRDDEVLLAMKKRGFGAGRWNGVGGKLEAGETVEDALVREAQEEIGVTPVSYNLVAENDYLQDADTADPWHMYVYTYLCDRWEGKPKESEEMAPKWFSVKDIPYEEMWDGDQLWLPPVLSGRKVRGNYVFDHNDTLTSYNIEEVEKL